jgi:peroxiredoxin
VEAHVSTKKGKVPLKEIIGNERAILYFYSEDDPDRTSKVRALQDHVEDYSDAEFNVYGVSVPPVTTKSSDVPQPVQNQQFRVLVDKDKEAVSALRRLNTQLREPQLALLISPEGRLSKMYSEATSKYTGKQDPRGCRCSLEGR